MIAVWTATQATSNTPVAKLRSGDRVCRRASKSGAQQVEPTDDQRKK
jgi:hypothetical protein